VVPQVVLRVRGLLPRIVPITNSAAGLQIAQRKWPKYRGGRACQFVVQML